jgi:hypothetical protein
MSHRSGAMGWISRTALALPFIVLGLSSCAGPVPTIPPAIEISVSPSSTIVAAGSITPFTAVFTRGSPGGGSLTWSVAPSEGGSITNEGVYTASATTGKYTVTAAWTLASNAPGGIFRGFATVELLPVPQVDAVLNPNLVQASGAIQVNGGIQNAGITGQIVPSVISTDPIGNLQVRSSFTPPVACAGGNTPCH